MAAAQLQVHEHLLSNCKRENVQTTYGPGEGVSYIIGLPRQMGWKMFRGKTQHKLIELGYVGVYLRSTK